MNQRASCVCNPGYRGNGSHCKGNEILLLMFEKNYCKRKHFRKRSQKLQFDSIHLQESTLAVNANLHVCQKMLIATTQALVDMNVCALLALLEMDLFVQVIILTAMKKGLTVIGILPQQESMDQLGC